MSHRVRLGRSELQVSPICYGCWQLSPRFWGDQPKDVIMDAMTRAFDIGINFYDTADAYGDGYSEEVLGKALADLPRDQIVVATKLYWHFYPDGRRHPDLSRNYIAEACDNSLKRLNMDYIDLYQCHAWDPLADPNEIVEGLEKLKKAGKIREYGVSNWNAEQMRLGHSVGGAFATLQPPYSLINRDIEAEVLPYCQANDMGTLVFSPLHKGLLTGKYKAGDTFTDLRENNPDFQGERFAKLTEAIKEAGEIAKKYDLTTVQMMLAATLMHPGITCAIVGVKKPAHVEDAAGAMGKTISREDYYKLRDLLSV